MKHIAIFASGSGTNAENIAKYFQNDENIEISLILSNKKQALVLEKAKKLNIKSIYFSKEDFKNSTKILDFLKNENIDFIVLAGFLLLIPKYLIQAYPNKIINIHPALLPKYGGKGMYGSNVHKAIIENNETESGISIHYVNEKYDEGNIIFQAKCTVEKNDTHETLAEKIHKLEHKHFPLIIKKTLN